MKPIGRYHAEVDRHRVTCSLARDATRWWAAEQMLGWSGRTKSVDGVGRVCIECGGTLEPTGKRPPLAPREAVEAKLAERQAAGMPTGADALALDFLVSEATIRRRLGRL